MKKCIYCKDNRGRRECPALGGLICSRCCGENRGINIDCPLDCKYFRKHESYQRAKLSDDYRSTLLEVVEDLFEDEERDTLGFLAFLEGSIYQYYEVEEKKAGQDKEVLKALEFLKRKKFSTIEIVETIGSELGEYLWNEIQEYLPKVPVSEEEAKEAIEKLEEVFDKYSDNQNPRQCLQGLLGHVEKDFPSPEEEEREIVSPQGLIMTPDDLRRQYRRG